MRCLASTRLSRQQFLIRPKVEIRSNGKLIRNKSNLSDGGHTKQQQESNYPCAIVKRFTTNVCILITNTKRYPRTSQRTRVNE